LSLRTFDPSVPHRSPLRASLDVPLGGRALRRAKTKPIAPLTAIRRIVAAIRLWRGRTRSRQQLRELDDHLLKDIGLKREDIVYTPERFTGSINILSREFEPWTLLSAASTVPSPGVRPFQACESVAGWAVSLANVQ
jgi:uncharacterized protein YjiS (DUF1127 family)